MDAGDNKKTFTFQTNTPDERRALRIPKSVPFFGDMAAFDVLGTLAIACIIATFYQGVKVSGSKVVSWIVNVVIWFVELFLIGQLAHYIVGKRTFFATRYFHLQ